MNYLSTVFTRKSAYARKSASLKFTLPFWPKIFNERPSFFSKGAFIWKIVFKGGVMWELHKKIL